MGSLAPLQKYKNASLNALEMLEQYMESLTLLQVR